jgi:hypothetical protein
MCATVACDASSRSRTPYTSSNSPQTSSRIPGIATRARTIERPSIDSKCNTDLWGATLCFDLPNLTLLPSPMRQVFPHRSDRLSRRLEAPPVGDAAKHPASHTPANGTRAVRCACDRARAIGLHAHCIHIAPSKRSYRVHLFGRRACWRSSPEGHICVLPQLFETCRGE